MKRIAILFGSFLIALIFLAGIQDDSPFYVPAKCQNPIMILPKILFQKKNSNWDEPCFTTLIFLETAPFHVRIVTYNIQDLPTLITH